MAGTAVKLHFWNAERSADYPPTEEQLALFPQSYAERYRNATPEEVRMGAVGSAVLLAMHLGVFSDEQLERGDHGSLSLKDDPKYICLSHSGPVTVLAVSEKPVGVDLERVGEVRETIAQRFFPASFRAELDAAPEDEKAETFYRLWTTLEAALKLDGRGLTVPPNEYEALLEQCDIRTEQHGNYVWSIATKKE